MREKPNGLRGRSCSYESALWVLVCLSVCVLMCGSEIRGLGSERANGRPQVCVCASHR